MNEPFDDPPEFTDEQLRAALQRVGEDARKEACAIGRPVMVIERGHFLRLHPDGFEEDLGPVRDLEASRDS